jgi:O-Antigen ligase/Tetratricopeptide repeat
VPGISLPEGRIRTRSEAASDWLAASVASLLPVFFIPFAVDGFIAPRAALALAAGAAVFGAGLLFGRRSLGRLGPPALAVATAAVASGVLSVAPNLSLVGAYGRYESAPMRLAYLGLLCGAAWLGRSKWIADGYLAGCGLASLEAIAQALMGALPRPDGNLGQPNLLGGLLAMAIPLALARTLGRRDEENPGESRPGDWRWLALVALLASGLAASASRSGWLAALVGVGLLGARLAPRHVRVPALAGASVVVGLAALLLLFSPLRHLNQDTGSARLGVWQDSLHVVAARPLLGWGEDTMGLVFGRYQSRDWEPGDNFDRAHTVPLDLAAAQGLLGLAANVWLFATWWNAVLRRRHLAAFAGAAAAYLAWAVLNFDWAPVTAPFWLLAGAAWPGAAAAGWRRGRWRATAAAGGLVVALALGVTAVAADVEYYFGRTAAAVMLDPLQPKYRAVAGGLEGLRAAAALNDPEPSAWLALGDAEAAAGHADQARAAYQRALELYPFYKDARRRLGLSP